MLTYSWDDLRRQARSLENELDIKLATFSTISSRPTHKTGHDQSSHYVVSGFAGGAQRENAVKSVGDASTLADDVDKLLQRLTQVNDQMSQVVDSSSVAESAARQTSTTTPPISTSNMTAGQLSQVHTAKRHREILRDYAQEFRQSKAKMVANQEREELLGSIYRESLDVRDGVSLSASGTSNFRSNPNTQSSSTHLLLDEQEKYYRSGRLIDDHLAVASTIRSTLRAQRLALKNASSGLHNLTARFPRIKQLVGKIDWRHRKDSIILGLVIALCISFLLIYKFS